MYRRPKFLEILLTIRREMALEADYDVDLFAELTRIGAGTAKTKGLSHSGQKDQATGPDTETVQLTTVRRA